MATGVVRVGSRSLRISNADKVLFPDGTTEGELVAYYAHVAAIMLPHIKGRPISLQRFPNGTGKPGFYQKEAPAYFPEWIDRVTIELRGGGSQEQVVCNNAATLVYLADQACITPHVWLSRAAKLDHPDRMILDLDPPTGEAFDVAKVGAFLLRDILTELGLVPFLMATGSRGLHVVTPLKAKEGFDTVREFAEGVAKLLVREDPTRFTIEKLKAKRKDRLFVDYLRNAYAQTAVPPYGVRARAEATVAAPLEWSELNKKGLHAASFTIRKMLQRLERKGDVWKTMQKSAKALPKRLPA